MYKSVIMVSRVLKEICADDTSRNTPFFVWDIRINVTGSNHMQQSEENNTGKSVHTQAIFRQIEEKGCQ